MLGEPFRVVLPRTAELAARADVVNELLRECAPAGATALPRVRAVRLPGVEFESSNCRNFLIEVVRSVDPRISRWDGGRRVP